MTTKSKFNWWKWGAIGAVALLIFYGGCLGERSLWNKKANVSDTTVNITTVLIKLDVKPDSVKQDSIVYFAQTLHDTLEVPSEPEIVYIDTGHFPTELVKDYYTRKFYNEDTAGVKIEGVVHKNAIEKMEVAVTRTDSMIRKTQIYEAPKPFVLSLSTSLLGNLNNPFHAQGIGLTAKFPNEHTLSVQAFNVIDHRPMVMVTKTWPIRLGNKTQKPLLPKITTSDTTVKKSTINIKK